MLSALVQLDWRNSKATIFGRGETPHAYVAVDDVAETTVAGCAALKRIAPVQASVMGMAWAADVQEQPASATALRALGIEPCPTAAYIDDVARGG